MANTDPIKVGEFTPFTILNRRFVIPVYQRLYAWEKPQIMQLLKDLWGAFKGGNDENQRSGKGHKDYYLGNVVLAAPPPSPTHAQRSKQNEGLVLIDGQQRMTTLWLMGFVFRKYDKESSVNGSENWDSFLRINGDLRLTYAIRPEDNAYLKSKLEGQDQSQAQPEGFNPLMGYAITYIEDFLKTEVSREERAPFAQYVLKHTRMVEVILPTGTDLNKYFEVMNSRGAQLEKQEILKARLLKNIKDEEGKDDELGRRYARIWEACSQMGQYIEKGQGKEKRKLLASFHTATDLKEIVKEYKPTQPNLSGNTLANIIDPLKNNAGGKAGKENKNENEDTGNDEDSPKVSSPLNFEAFLKVVWVLYKGEWKANLSNQPLLEIFKEFEEDAKPTPEKQKRLSDDTKGFLDALLKYRILLDRYILKSTLVKDRNRWEIRRLKRVKVKGELNEQSGDEDEYERSKWLPDTTLIQAMLNVSTETENWLIPTLNYLGKQDAHLPHNWEDPELEEADRKFTRFLEQLDHDLAESRLPGNNLTQVSVAKDYLSGKVGTDSGNNAPSLIPESLLNNSTGTPNYWFYKLDYILMKSWKKEWQKEKKGVWKEWIKANKRLEEDWKGEIRRFQFRTSRSVEHYFPQNLSPGTEWNGKELHNFGNLALVTVSSNSSYSDNKLKVKREQFRVRSHKFGIESLKLLLMHTTPGEWSPEKSETHGKQMLKLLNCYHQSTGHE